MLKNKKAVFITVGVLTLLIIVPVLSQTVLFTWSPLRIGYNRFRFEEYDVYTRENTLEEVFYQCKSTPGENTRSDVFSPMSF